DRQAEEAVPTRSQEDRQSQVLVSPEERVVQEPLDRAQNLRDLAVARSGRDQRLLCSSREILESDRVLADVASGVVRRQVERNAGGAGTFHELREIGGM